MRVGTVRGHGLTQLSIVEARKRVRKGGRVVFAAPDRASAERFRERVREVFADEEMQLVSFTYYENSQERWFRAPKRGDHA